MKRLLLPLLLSLPFLYEPLFAQISDEALLDGFHWRNIGPANQGGRIVDIEAVENDFRRVFLATASGGVWRPDNAGTTWTPIFDHYETACIGDVALFQPNPAKAMIINNLLLPERYIRSFLPNQRILPQPLRFHPEQVFPPCQILDIQHGKQAIGLALRMGVKAELRVIEQTIINKDMVDSPHAQQDGIHAETAPGSLNGNSALQSQPGSFGYFQGRTNGLYRLIVSFRLVGNKQFQEAIIDKAGRNTGCFR